MEILSNDGYKTHVAVSVYQVRGDHYDKLKFPARFTITLELLNRHRDQDHYRRDIHCEVPKRGVHSVYGIGKNFTFIPHADLEWNPCKQTQYLKNDCLKFRITEIVVQI